ncbi:hypothetical protein HK099_000737 [Clydaea vesicula]|uniref:Uncharacterized protein n=1 Tax=Clydaea vesicula TaxID=447962 RepID=A0AAD5TWC7_9FUNG|nr:hypothetical protein HK099_000737 [Clydaea vesicula]
MSSNSIIRLYEKNIYDIMKLLVLFTIFSMSISTTSKPYYTKKRFIKRMFTDDNPMIKIDGYISLLLSLKKHRRITMKTSVLTTILIATATVLSNPVLPDHNDLVGSTGGPLMKRENTHRKEYRWKRETDDDEELVKRHISV